MEQVPLPFLPPSSAEDDQGIPHRGSELRHQPNTRFFGNKNGAADEPRRRFKFWEDTANTPSASARRLRSGTASMLASVNFPFILFALALSEHELRNSHSHLAGAPCRHLSRPVSVDG